MIVFVRVESIFLLGQSGARISIRLNTSRTLSKQIIICKKLWKMEKDRLVSKGISVAHIKVKTVLDPLTLKWKEAEIGSNYVRCILVWSVKWHPAKAIAYHTITILRDAHDQTGVIFYLYLRNSPLSYFICIKMQIAR